MAEIGDLNVTDASNTGRWPENMAFSAVNDAGRAMEGYLARWFNDWNGSIVASGSSNAFTITSNRTISSLANNTVMWFRANHTINGAATLNLNSLGAKDIVRATGAALTSGDITSGQIVGVYYNSTLDDWVLITPAVQGTASESATGLIELATEAEVEALDSSRAVRASTMHRHPGVSKFWGYATVSGGTPTLQTSYNMTSITDTAAGKLTGTIATDFSSANWCSHGQNGNSGDEGRVCGVSSKAAGSIVLVNKTEGSLSGTDPDEWNFGGFGDHA